METTLQIIGGDGGSEFIFTGRHNGATLKKIGVAAGNKQIKAVRAELTDGRVETFGRANAFREFTFALGERITKLSLWRNGAGSRLGGIRFWTSSGREFFAHMSSKLKKEHSIDVGSGVCLGLDGRSGADIDCMGFLFISAIRSAELTDMSYPSLATYTPQVNKEYIKSVSYHNNTTEAQEQRCVYSRSVTKSTTWRTTNQIEGVVSVSVEAGVPGLVQVFSEFSVTVGAKHYTKITSSETITESDEVNVKIPAGKSMSVEFSVGRAVIDLPFSATVRITCLNGSELFISSTGNYTGVAYTAVHVNITESERNYEC